MNVICFELRAANKECKEKFTDIAKVEYAGKPIFDYACDYINDSSSYRRAGRRLEILEIADSYINVKLTSETPLEMASKSLAGFSRELIRIDQEMHLDESKQLFKTFIYNKTLFKNRQIENGIQDDVEIEKMSDVDALQLCVQVFCNTMTATKEEALMNELTKKQIKKALADYKVTKRLLAYNEQLRKERSK